MHYDYKGILKCTLNKVFSTFAVKIVVGVNRNAVQDTLFLNGKTTLSLVLKTLVLHGKILLMKFLFCVHEILLKVCSANRAIRSNCLENNLTNVVNL